MFLDLPVRRPVADRLRPEAARAGQLAGAGAVRALAALVHLLLLCSWFVLWLLGGGRSDGRTVGPSVVVCTRVACAFCRVGLTCRIFTSRATIVPTTPTAPPAFDQLVIMVESRKEA